MTEISKMSAWELQQQIEHSPEPSALKEVHRLRVICQDIIELINTDAIIWLDNDYEAAVSKIEEIAGGYFQP